jgi:DNA primase
LKGQSPVVQEILQRVSLVEVVQEFVPLKKRGRTWWGLCPFHSEKTPSFSVSEEKRLYYCFGCQAGGTALKFLKEVGGLTGQEALKRLADRAGVQLPEDARRDPAEDAAARERADLSHAVQAAQEFFRSALAAPGGAAAREYLASRGIPAEVADRYGLGYGGAPGELTAFLERRKVPMRHAEAAGVVSKSQVTSGWYDRFRGRLVCPVLNLDGTPVAFSARQIPPEEDGPKYVNSPESLLYTKGEAVFGLHPARTPIRQNKRAILVEGNFDVLSLVAAGVPNVVAPLGTALTNAQLRLLRRFAESVVVFFDGDEAGRKASRRAVGLLIEEGIEGVVAEAPAGEDPDTLARHGGREAVEAVIARARPMVTWLLDALVEVHGRTPHGLRKVLEDAKTVFQAERDPFRHGRYREELARVLNVDVREVSRLLRSPGTPDGKADEAAPCPAPERQLLELLLLHPYLIDRYLEDERAGAGLLTHPEAREVLQDLMNANLAGEDPAEVFVLKAEGAGPVRAAVGRALQFQDAHPEPDTSYGQVMVMLERSALQREQEDLARRVAVAESAGRGDEAEDLHRQHFEMVRRIMALKAAMPGTGGAR